MKKISLEDHRKEIENMKERDFVNEITDFIKSDDCYYGYISVLYGLKRTGKKTAMKQALLKLPQDIQYAFYELTDGDEMSDVKKVLVEEHDRGVTVVCFDEVTRAKDFIEHASVLPDIFAKMGMRIIVTGTDSLGFQLAEYDELYGRTDRLSTTHISFAEHCRVLGTNDIDDYIQYGGLMRKGTDDSKIFVYDYESARRYIDGAVSQNICNSIKKSDRDNCLDVLTIDELACIIEKLVELYSGTFNEKTVQKELTTASVNFPVKKLSEIGTDKAIIKRIAIEEENITKDFLKVINADKKISHPITERMVEKIRNYLLEMHVLSATKKVTYSYGKAGWTRSNEEHEFYIVQPAIKYYHLQAGKRFIEKEDYYKDLLQSEKEYMQKRLDEKIKGDMTEQIIVFDVDAALPEEKYLVLKPCFTINDKSAGAYDMLVYDREEDRYWGFEIKHTTNAFYKQEQHLQNDKITSFMNREYGKREHVCVLYRGNPFVSSAGTIYLNITDFCLAVDKYRDMEKVFEKLTRDLPVREL